MRYYPTALIIFFFTSLIALAGGFLRYTLLLGFFFFCMRTYACYFLLGRGRNGYTFEFGCTKTARELLNEMAKAQSAVESVAPGSV